MPHAGQVSLLNMAYTDRPNGKVRPVVLLGRVPGNYDDWLVCMISSRLHQYIPDFDEIIAPESEDFAGTGLRIASVIRIARIAVVNINQLQGAIGEISPERLHLIRHRLATWLLNLL